jgi:hypothetical protein
MPLHLEPPRYAAEHRIPGDGQLDWKEYRRSALNFSTRTELCSIYTQKHTHHGDHAGCDDCAILPPLRRKQTILYADSVTNGYIIHSC